MLTLVGVSAWGTEKGVTESRINANSVLVEQKHASFYLTSLKMLYQIEHDTHNKICIETAYCPKWKVVIFNDYEVVISKVHEKWDFSTFGLECMRREIQKLINQENGDQGPILSKVDKYLNESGLQNIIHACPYYC